MSECIERIFDCFYIQELNVIGISFYQPKFCPNASWDPNGITFANANTYPFGLFIDLNNDVYAAEQGTNRVEIWSKNGTIPIRTLSGSLNSPGAIFVSDEGDIYVDNGNDGQVVKWTANETSSVVVMNVSAQCLGLFIDINNTLYCCINTYHIVVKMSLNVGEYTSEIVVGTGVAGSNPDELCYPNGIFVDTNFTLYVADWYNDRIQQFYLGETNGITVAGATAPGTIVLFGPTGVMLDGDGYLFIVDAWNQRIVASGPNGFQCIIGCSTLSGSTSTEFNYPRTLGFDSYGNIYVSDRTNNRIQKFILMTNSCGKLGILYF